MSSRFTASSNRTVELDMVLSGVLVFTQQNILNAGSGGANQVAQVKNFDAAEIGAVEVKRWPSFKREALFGLQCDFSLRLRRVLPADHS